MEIKDKELHRVSSTAIIYNGDKFLLTRRSLSKKAFPGKWTVPGGGLETDDYINTKPSTSAGQWYFALNNSLKREIKEETNVEVGPIKYLLDLTFIRPDGVPVLVLSFYANYISGEVKLDDDSIDYAWVTYEEAKKYDIIDGILEEIKMVDEIIKGKDKDSVEFGLAN
ncbi:MAG: NUDIX domain-containing protein [Candidatus Pacebacteria bacterium]|nr:NUDIX domain-containing protein [Candidatus Paceibacterota bacterium]